MNKLISYKPQWDFHLFVQNDNQTTQVIIFSKSEYEARKKVKIMHPKINWNYLGIKRA